MSCTGRHEKFDFQTAEQLRQKIEELGAGIALSEDTAPLGRQVQVGGRRAPNAIAVLPMEGCDANIDGGPSELLERRYLRFAAGGAGLLWWEACAVVEEGRANPRQMMLTPQNLRQYAALLERVKREAAGRNGAECQPLHILQLTHSGRYSRPEGHAPRPLIAQRDPALDAAVGVEDESAVVTDGYLDSLVERYVEAALLAQRAGFDGVDIKSCHRYLLSELLAAHTRPGRYGGSFENRTRLHRAIIDGIRAATGPGFLIACRFNVFDAHPYPYGFGQEKGSGPWEFDPAEPVTLVKLLCNKGVDLLSNSAGNPYYKHPQVTRPFDTSSTGIQVPDEHPLTSIARLFHFTRTVQQAAGKVPVVGNGYSWLRHFAPLAGAANLASGGCAFMGLGRSSFAYPDAPRLILQGQGMQAEKCCIACSKCTQLMRDHGCTGCVVRDSEVYAPLYKQYRQEAIARERVG